MRHAHNLNVHVKYIIHHSMLYANYYVQNWLYIGARLGWVLFCNFNGIGIEYITKSHCSCNTEN